MTGKMKLWCVKMPEFPENSGLLFSTLAYNRTDAIAVFSSNVSKAWKHFYRRGWRTVKVEVEMKEL